MAASPPRPSIISSPGELEDKRPKVDVHQFNLLEELHARGLEPAPYDHTQTRGTAIGEIRRAQLRGSRRDADHPAQGAVQGPFHLRRAQRARRAARRSPTRCCGDFERAHRRLDRGAGQEGRRTLHELRHVLRMRQLRHLLPADGGVARRRRRNARSGATCRPITPSASAATSARTSARPATSRWASGSSA